MGCSHEIFKLVWRRPSLSGLLVKGHLSRVSRQSHISANDKGDNEMIPEAMHKSPGIYLTPEENHGKLQLGDHLRKVVRPVIASNGVSCLQGTSRKEKEAKREDGEEYFRALLIRG